MNDPGRPERAVHLVGGHVDEAKRRRVLGREAGEVRAAGLEQLEGADDVRVHEVRRTGNRPIDVRFGREVDDRRDLEIAQQPADEAPIGDVAAGEDVTGVVVEAREAVGVTGVRELVEVDDAAVAAPQRRGDEIRSDETGPTGDEQCFSWHARRASYYVASEFWQGPNAWLFPLRFASTGGQSGNRLPWRSAPVLTVMSPSL